MPAVAGLPCRSRGCKKLSEEYRLKDKKKLISRYCPDHTCQVGWGCKNSTKTKASYCEEHKTCSEEGCPTKGRDLQDCASPWYCSNHECPFLGCHLSAKPRHMHTSSIPVPPNIPNSLPMKKCQGGNDCPHRTVDGSDFCQNHKCIIGDCEDAKFNASGRCLVHQPCNAPTCPNVVRWNEMRDRPERFCWQHEKCAMQSCPTAIEVGELHCEFHQCKLPNCRGERYVWETLSDYCRIHTCGTQGCTKPIEGRQYPPHNVTSILYRHCHEHTCNRQECVDESVVELGPCRKHSCSAQTCNHNVYDPHNYCGIHECQTKGCYGPAIHDNQVDYCLEKHACMWGNDPTPCRNARDLSTGFEALCIFHSIKQAEKVGEDRVRQEQREAEQDARNAAAREPRAPTPQDQGPPPPRPEDSRGRRSTPHRRGRYHEPRWGDGYQDWEDSDEEFPPRYPPF